MSILKHYMSSSSALQRMIIGMVSYVIIFSSVFSLLLMVGFEQELLPLIESYNKQSIENITSGIENMINSASRFGSLQL